MLLNEGCHRRIGELKGNTSPLRRRCGRRRQDAVGIVARVVFAAVAADVADLKDATLVTGVEVNETSNRAL